MKKSKVFIGTAAFVLALGAALAVKAARTANTIFYETTGGFKGSYVTTNTPPCNIGGLGCVEPIPGTSFQAQLYSTSGRTSAKAYELQ